MQIPSCVLLALLLGASHSVLADALYSVTDLGSLSGGVIGNGINNAGQITGLSDTSSGATHAFLYTNGQRTDLGTLGGHISEGADINNAGQVTGSAETSDLVRAFLYTNGQMMDLGALDDGFSFGGAINDAGQVTGTSGFHAFLYSNGQMMDIGPGTGLAINDAGPVTGVSSGHAFLYSNGQMMDLNDLIDPALGITLSAARGINDHGQILANGGSRAYLLTPVPEPSTWALLSISFLGSLVWSRLIKIDSRRK